MSRENIELPFTLGPANSNGFQALGFHIFHCRFSGQFAKSATYCDASLAADGARAFVLDGRYHRIRIEVPDHKGYQVRARRGYFAKANRENNSRQPSPSGPAPN